jgi:hypothetical protein
VQAGATLAGMTPEQLADLIAQGKWIAVLAFVVGLFVRLSKEDVTWFKINVPAQYRAWAAIVLGIVGGVIDKVAAGTAWVPAILAGLLAAVTAIMGHELVVEGIRGGREIGEKSPGSAGALILPVLVWLALSQATACGGGAATIVCPIIHAADELCPYVTVVFADGTRQQVPRSEIAGLALRHLQERVQGGDAGAAR